MSAYNVASLTIYAKDYAESAQSTPKVHMKTIGSVNSSETAYDFSIKWKGAWDGVDGERVQECGMLQIIIRGFLIWVWVNDGSGSIPKATKGSGTPYKKSDRFQATVKRKYLSSSVKDFQSAGFATELQ